MKVILIAWLLDQGQPIPESYVSAQFNTMQECVDKGELIKHTFNGKKTLTVGDYICTIQGESI